MLPTANLQGLFIQPRKGQDPRVAKVDETYLSRGNDGILYRMLDREDWNKYRTLSDAEMKEELNRSREIKENMYTLTGKFKDGKYKERKPAGSGVKMVAPQFGTQSRSRKIERRNWEQDLNTMANADGVPGGLRSSSDHHGTMATLVQNSQSKAIEDERAGRSAQRAEYQEYTSPVGSPLRFQANTGGLNKAQGAEARIHSAVEAMKDKYEQNLRVVETLFDEKRYMERKIDLLEARLQGKTVLANERSQGQLQQSLDAAEYEAMMQTGNLAGADPRMNMTYAAVPPSQQQQYRYEGEEEESSRGLGGLLGDQDMPPPAYEEFDPETTTTSTMQASQQQQQQQQRRPRPSTAPQQRRGSRGGQQHEDDEEEEDTAYSAAELAGILNSQDDGTGTVAAPGKPSQPQENTRARYGGRGGEEGYDHSSSRLDRTYQTARSDSAPRARTQVHQNRFRASTNSRAASADLQRGRKSYSGSRVVSSNLQADADRYIQKRRLLDQQERMKKLEEENYQQKMKERYLRASINGKEFTNMKRRQEMAEELSQKRLEKQKQKEWEKEQKEKAERRAKSEANKQSMMMVTKNQLSWRELQEIEETKRRDRIERRKQQVAQMSALPSSIAENMQKPKRAVASSEGDAAGGAAGGGGEYKAEDPAKVAAKLARQQKVWDLKMQREKEKMKDARETKMLNARAHMSSSGHTGEVDGASYLNKTGMEVRQEQYEARRKHKAEEAKLREAEEAKRQAQALKKKQDKLLTIKVPVGKPTQAAIARAEQIRRSQDHEAREEKRYRNAMKKKEVASKEASAVIKTIINERETERRNSHGGFVELSKTNKGDDGNRAAEEYKAKLMANQKRIEDSLSNRKSLMERHDERVAVKNAHDRALEKIAGAVGVEAGPEGDAGHTANEDFFDIKEQIKLGMKSI
mmetsp:Transcript_21479/g.35966  ORF Transcript_21479/g.35966 Transcript_21479/m.35966 type:complete len:919 (+) Transcript_21479:47-2803(+)